MPNEAALLVSLQARMNDFDRQMKKAGAVAGSAVKEIEDRFNQANPRFAAFEANATAIGRRIGNLIGIGIAAGLAAEVASIKALDELGKRAQDTRLSAQNIVGLRYAGALGGVDEKGIDAALDKFSEASKKTKADAEELYKALGNIGPQFVAAFQNAPNQAAALQTVMTALASTTDEVKRAQLAQQAFGTDNERLIALFGRGGNALSDFASQARAAGIVMDDALIARAQEAQQKLNALAMVISAQLKVALLELVPVIQSIANALPAVIEAASDAISKVAGLQFATNNVLRNRINDLRSGVNNNDRQPLSGAEPTGPNADMIRKLNRYGNAALGTGTPNDSRTRAQQLAEAEAELARRGEYDDPRDRVRRSEGRVAETLSGSSRFAPRPSLSEKKSSGSDRDRVEDTIKFLDLEIQRLQASGEERARIINQEKELQFLRRAGVTEESEAGRKITERVRKLGELEAANKRVKETQKALNDATKLFGDTLVDVFDSAVLQGQKLEDVLAGVLRSLARASVQAALMGSGPLAGLFGTAGPSGQTGGLIGAGVRAFGGARATGGPVEAGRPYLIGERGPELMVPTMAGHIVPNHALPRAGGQTIVQGSTFNIHAPGADAAALGRVEQAVLGLNRSLETRALRAVAESRGRGLI